MSNERSPFDPSGVRDFREQAIRGGLWTLSAQAVRFALQVVATVLLSRLLTPDEYGLYAVVFGVVSFLSLFKDLGLGMSTLQTARLTQSQASAVFWINTATGVLLAAVTAIVAPLVSRLFREPRLTMAMLAIALCFIPIGVRTQPMALLRRRLRLDTVTKVEVAAWTSGYTVAILAAALGAGYWALILMTLVVETALAVAGWVACDWRPNRPRHDPSVRPLLTFGGHMTGFEVLGFLTSQLDNLIVGWYWGPQALGYYDKAYQVLLLPVQQFSRPIAAVAHATLSRLSDEPTRYIAYLRQYLLLSTAFGMPIAAFLFVTADTAIPQVLGEQWLPVVPVFRALAPAGFVMTFTAVLAWIFVSLGRTRRQLVWGTWTTALTVLSFVVGLPWGPVGVATAFSVCRILLVVPNTLYCCHTSPIRSTALFGIATYPAVASVLAAGVTWILAARCLRADGPPLKMLLVEGVIFALCYLGCWLALPVGRRTLAVYLHTMRALRERRQISAGPSC